MPALLHHALESQLQRREWKQTVGQSGMTPTAFAFLIPVFVVVVFAPFLCVFCIRKRNRGVVVPARKPAKKPALRRAEARERLKLVTDVSSVTDAGTTPPRQHDATVDDREQAHVNVPEPELAQTNATEAAQPIAPAQEDSSSIRERECAICLSTLHAPSPPEAALLASQPTPVDEAAIRPPTATNPSPTDQSISTTTTSIEPEAILKLRACGHEFHSECLVSWFVLRKTTCPICRAAYISKEEMKAYEDEEAAIGQAEQQAVPEVVPEPPRGRTSNWRYFWRGESVWTRNRVERSEANAAAGQNGSGSGSGNGDVARSRDEDVEMARWTHFARTRR